jgi:aspartyl-tRNA(Asn)/glutamyl-tRNA(Gln) amidotransferase subunit C
MTAFTTDDVFKLAKLSNISVSKSEAADLVTEIKVILDYVGQLQELDLSNTEPTYQVSGLSDVMRSDEEVDYGVSPKELLKNVPATENNYIKVKRVL